MKATKLLVPPRPGGVLVPRPRLEQQAALLMEAPVSIVRAGGGYGKTTLLCEWAEALRPAAIVAWLSLDEYDASATALCEALDASLRRALTAFGTSARALLDRGIDDPRRLAAALSNELFAWSVESERDAVLFVDDVQFVTGDGGAAALLGELLTGLPDGIHVVLASRSPLHFPPLGKLRATNRLIEIDQDELRFNREEAARLFADGTGDEYFAFTEGWPIALGLLAAIARTNDAAFDRAMERTRESLFDFLAEEVVARLPADLAHTLSILAVPPNIDGTLCGILAGVSDPQTFVQALTAYGLYVSKADPQTWRLHSLFRTFLIERLRRIAPGDERQTRLSYAHWLREQGRKTEALEQLLDAGEYEEIVPFVSEALQAIHFSDRYRTFIRLLSSVPDAVMRAKPMLHRFYALALARDGKKDSAEEHLQYCYDRALAVKDYLTACAAQIELGVIADDFSFMARRTYQRSERCFRTALELAQRPQLAGIPVALYQSHWHLGMVYAARGDFDRAFEHLRIAEKMEREGERHVDMLLLEIGTVHGWRGDWLKALEYAELAEELFRTGGGDFWIANALMEQARAHTQIRTEPSRAVELARSAVTELRAQHREEDLAEANVVAGHALLTTEPPAIDEAAAAAAAADEALARRPHPSVRFDNELLKTEIALFARREEDARCHIEQARRIARASGSAWQSAMTAFYDGARELAFGDETAARECFARANAALAEVGDRYNGAIVRAALLACDARAGHLTGADFRDFLGELRQGHVPYAMRGAPRSAAELLAWSLRHDEFAGDAIELLAEGIAAHPGPLQAVANDRSAGARARSAAIGILAKATPSASRALIAGLAADEDPAVAGSAATALQFLPNAGVPPLHVAVVGGLRVRIEAEEFDENSERWGRRRAAELLRLLALAGRPVTKTALFAALWPENPNVTDTTLRVTLHMVRRALQPGIEGAGDYVDYDGTIVRLRPELVADVDAVAALAAIRRAQLLRAQGDVAGAREAAASAAGVFDLSPREEDAPEWLRPYVRSWRDSAVAAHLLLASIERECSRPVQSLAEAERAAAIDPLSEPALCAMLDALLDAGKNEQARAAFVDYRRRLSAQLDASPGPAAMDRYTKIASRVERPAAADDLSGREREVLSLVARGLSNKQIAGELSLSVWTVNNHLAKILRKLNVDSRTAAVAAVSGGLSNG